MLPIVHTSSGIAGNRQACIRCGILLYGIACTAFGGKAVATGLLAATGVLPVYLDGGAATTALRMTRTACYTTVQFWHEKPSRFFIFYVPCILNHSHAFYAGKTKEY